MKKQITLILSSLSTGNEKAVLNIEHTNEEINGQIRLYNFEQKPSGILTLGFLSNGKVIKSALSEVGKNLYTFSAEIEDNLEKFSCALVNVKGGKATPLLLGATNGKKPSSLDYELAENIHILDDENLTCAAAEEAVKNIEFDNEEQAAIDNAIACEMGGSEKCLHCKYRTAFFEDCETENIQTKKQTFPQHKIAVQEEKFYDEIKEQLEVLFERYPEETFLCEIIANSKWVKVDYDDSGEYYVIGLIYDNNEIRYICYGVPGQYDTAPPRELSENAQWLPLDPNKPEDLGYWLTYQDANSGESVEVNVS